MPETSLESDALAIFQRHRRDVYGWAQRILGDHHEALDVVQDVFLKWFEQAQFVAPVSPRAWLRTVTTNRALDLVRVRHRRPEAGPLPREIARPGDETTRRDELRAAITRAMEALSEQQRAVLVAKVYEGLSFARIAEELDIAVPTAKTHYLRALEHVRDRLPRGWNPRGGES